MTAPVFDLEITPYILTTKTTESSQGSYMLEAEFVYEYNNVWDVKIAFVRFFRKPYDELTQEETEPDHYKRVKVEGDSKNMRYCEICVWENMSFEDAKEKEMQLKKRQKEIEDCHKKFW